MVNRAFKPVQSLQRGLALFEAISQRKEGMSLKELAAVIGCSPPAAYHLVHTLVDCGYVRRQENPARYVTGEKWLQLAEGQRRDRFYQVVYEQMKNLAQELPGVMLYFSEYIGDSVVVRAHVPADAIVVREEVNHVLPPYVSAGGLAHLAFWPQEVREAHEARYPFEAYGLRFWESRSAFEAALADLRENGFYLMPESSPLRLKLALPVLRPGGGLAAALTVQWNLRERNGLARRKKELVRASRKTGESITRNLSS
jgi:DNA-binding IclR family transcriptional regulator